MQCSYCSTVNPSQARFCMGCGTKLVQGIVCETCHTLLPPQAHFCYHCGGYISQPAGAAAMLQTAAPQIQAAPVTQAAPAIQAAPVIQAATAIQAAPVTQAAPAAEVPAPDPAVPAETPAPRPVVRPVAEMLPSLQRYLPAALYEPLERRPKEKDLLAVRDHLAALTATCKTYLPGPVIQNPQFPGIPAGGMRRGVFLFGDVSGFTPLSEKLKALGQVGAEQITGIINALFTELVKVLFRHGGTLLKFGGDAMLGMWDADTPESVLRACSTAMAIQHVLSQPQFAEISALGEKHTLKIKVGISAGPYFAAHIGTPPSAFDLNGTMAFVTTGETVNLAEEAEGHAHPGQVALTQYASDLVSGQVELGPVERDPDETYRRLLSAPELDGEQVQAAESPEPPDGPLDAQLTYLVDRLDRLTPYLSDELVSRIVTNPIDARIQPGHRPVTVMFVNYKGLSRLIEKHGESDPDLITQHLNHYFCKMASIVERYEGTLARMDQYAVGDRIVIFFGAPRAHEDDPVRATYTALEMQDIVQKEFAALRTSSGVFRFEQRIGINTGTLFAGNAGAPNLRQEYTLMGDDINMAARLMSNAPWGQIFVSRRTRDHVAPFIELEDRGEIKVKGKEIKIPTFAATGRRGEVGRTRGLDSGETPLTGREDQLHALQDRAQLYFSGRGQILAISGHSGLGKSRLLHELQTWIKQMPAGQTVQWVEARALSFSEQTGYWMAAQMMRSLLEVPNNASQDDVLYKLSERAESLLGDQAMDAVPYLAHMMGLELGEEWAWVRKEDPKVRQKQTFWAVSELAAAQAKTRPLVIALDDLHWGDEASLALFGHLLKITDHAPVMICLLFRPLREQGCWKLRERAADEYPHRFFELALEPLNAANSIRVLENLLPGAVFPTERRTDILGKAAGNPFYLEELVRSLIEAGAVVPDADQPGAWKVTDQIRQMTIPVSLHAAIAARIDRLTEDSRMALQTAAVIGRQFRLELLRNLAQAQAEINLWLSQLERGGLLTSCGELIDPSYNFPDALVHEVAYDSLLVTNRQQIHKEVGSLFETFFEDAIEANCEVLAFHFSRSSDQEKALKYLQMAAKKSEEKYASATAVEFHKKILQIQRERGNAAGQASALYAMGAKSYEMGDYDSARAWLSEASDLQQKIQDPKSQAWSEMYLGMVDLKQGDYPHAAMHHQAALDSARARQDSFQEGIHLTNLARVNMRLGQLDLALQQFEQSLALKKSNHDITGQAFALFYMGITRLYQGRVQDTASLLADSQAMWQQVPFNERGLAYVEQGLGMLEIQREHYDQAAAYLLSAIRRCESLVLKAELIENQSYLGQALLGQKDLPGARQASDKAVQLLAKQKDVEEEQVISYNHYRVLSAGADPQAADYLTQAEGVMQEQAERITDPRWRETFLSQIRVNQAIRDAVQGTRTASNGCIR